MAGFVANTWGRSATSWSPLSAPAAHVATRPAPVVPKPQRTDEAPLEAAVTDWAARVAELEAALAREQSAHQESRTALDAAREAAGRATSSIEEEATRLHNMAEGLLSARRRLVDELREGVGSLILAGARKLAGEALRDQPGLVEALVADAVATLGRDGLVVRVAPSDAERARLALQGTGAEVIADAAVDGGCVATTPFGSVDASFATAAEALRIVVERWQTAGWRAEDHE